MSRNWFEKFDDSFWLLGAKGADDRAQARFIKMALKLRKGQSVLDAPCGRGRIALHLAQSGCRVTAFDRNRKFLATARQRFRRHGLSGRFVLGDLRQLAVSEPYDAIVNWYTSFGYFSDEENRCVLKQFAAALKPGGRLLIELPHREYILRNFEPQVVTPKVRMTNRWNPHTQRLASTWTPTAQFSVAKTSRFSLRMYSVAQLTRLLSSAGLPVESTYGNVQGDPLSRKTRRLIVVGRKQT
jgi:ubiquinone/menaquinone biosynthesis C-methylase UbiE